MPFAVRKKGKKFEVFNKDTGESKGVSDTEEMAQRHMAALYANSGDVKATEVGHPFYGNQYTDGVSHDISERDKVSIDAQKASKRAWKDGSKEAHQEASDLHSKAAKVFKEQAAYIGDKRSPSLYYAHVNEQKIHEALAQEHLRFASKVKGNESMRPKSTDVVWAHQADELSLDDLQQAICTAAKADGRFTTGSDKENGFCPWCVSVLRDEDEQSWAAVISACDGKYYRVPFTIDESNGDVTLGTEATSVNRRTSWVSATQSKTYDFNGQAVVKAAGTTDGAGKGHATRKSAAAMQASKDAHDASSKAHDSGEDEDHDAAADAHDEASDAHKAAMLAHAKSGNADEAGYHAKAMTAHDACATAHRGDDEDAVVQSSQALFQAVELKGYRSLKRRTATVQARQVVHCRANGSKLAPSKDWSVDEPVTFMYMPAGVHTINAGLSGPVTKGRDAAVNLTVECDPDRDAATCQASLQEMVEAEPTQKPYGCFEHEEKSASVWAKEFSADETGVMLTATPSKAGAEDVNGRNRRSWSPSFSTDAEYAKCTCRHCEENVAKCSCDHPSLYFPKGARGSTENPARITGVDFVVGTLTNKPAFRAIAPVKARQAKVTAEEMDTDSESDEYKDAAKTAALKSKVAQETEKAYPDGERHGAKMQAHRSAQDAHHAAAFHAESLEVKQHHLDKAKEHGEASDEHYKVVAKDAKAGDLASALQCVRACASVDTILATMAEKPKTAPHSERDVADQLAEALAGVRKTN